LTPTSPTPAFDIGERISDPLTMYLGDIFTIPCNLAGLPGMSIPCGISKSVCPIGLQLIGRPFEEEKIFTIGSIYQAETDWHLRIPPICNDK
jgi:aspartyl-tRNA(Asn)/glutamyl-tRNA(Gln) amidotransferase subunit A